MGDINYEKLKRSLEALKEQYRNFLSLDKENLSDINKEAVRESVIKRFEICYDTLWKHFKKYLQAEKNFVDLPNSPNGIFRRAFEAAIIDEDRLKRFMNYNELRGLAAYDYSSAKADKALERAGDFIQEAEALYKMMTASGQSRGVRRADFLKETESVGKKIDLKTELQK